MLNKNQIRGMLLEEVILSLLKNAGYKTIESTCEDSSLKEVSAGLAVKGRGTHHQIDAIADSLIHHPFSNPQRLLLEAKCYSSSRTIGIDILRNAFGVLQDVNEYWVPGQPTSIARKRYHYQYAVFSTSNFTKPAQEYAFAHDIYVVPLANSAFLAPIINLIRDLPATNLDFQRSYNFQLKALRQKVRKVLQNNDTYVIEEICSVNSPMYNAFTQLKEENDKISGAFIATLGNSFPIFLVPKNAETLNSEFHNKIRIYRDGNAWYLKSRDDELLFSFDLPTQLFEMYAKDGLLSRSAALDLKEGYMSTIQAFKVDHGILKIINLKLDQSWIRRIRELL